MKYMRMAKSLTIDKPILEEIEQTKGPYSTSERVNALLRQALEQERYQRLEQEAAQFFSESGRSERQEARAFQRASKRTLKRD